MAENGLYIAPGGIFPTIDDNRNGITDDSNKGEYQRVVVPDIFDSTLVFNEGNEVPVPNLKKPKSSTRTRSGNS